MLFRSVVEDRGRRQQNEAGEQNGCPARAPRWRSVLLAGAVLLLMTAVFDNVMIGIGLVDYNPDLISGAFIGIAPLEDFAYAIAAAVLLPSLWALLPSRKERDRA